ncbi:hypothetical protein [Methylobacterium sp. 77]|uniref:hypothetical protein n=1 Tax=Methylobacterium sp. 77 TaxID=1101192 RepID=UPI0012DE70AA|nr:hypothetical protein [Methylobacterium sp. 77]
MAGQAIQLDHITQDDVIARCVIYPIHFVDDGVFSKNALMRFENITKVSKPDYAISVVPRSLLATEDEVHQYGCRTASRKNVRMFQKWGIDGTIQNRSFYCGYYEIEVSTVLDISQDEYSVQVVLSPENSEPSHSEIQFIANTNKTQTQLRDARGDLLIKLNSKLRGPQRHICSTDKSHADLVARLELPSLPANQNVVL